MFRFLANRSMMVPDGPGAGLAVPLEYHQQDEDDYCSAACVQMVLQTLGRDVNGDRDQQVLLSVISKNTQFSNYTADPKAVATVLTSPPSPVLVPPAPAPQPHGVTFVAHPEKNKDTLSRKIVWSLKGHGLPPVVLVWGKRHWLLVSDYEISIPGGPTSSDQVYEFGGFMLFNPAPYLNEPFHCDDFLPPPHDHNDGCGNGINIVADCNGHTVNRAIKTHHVSYIGWVSTYLTDPIDFNTGEPKKNGHFVIVCKKEVADAAVASRPVPPFSKPTDPQVDVSQVVQAAWQGMIDHNLHLKDPWNRVLTNTTTIPQHDGPIPFFRSDINKTLYAVAFYSAATGENLVATLVDGHSRRKQPPAYLESIAVPQGRAMAQLDLQVLRHLGVTIKGGTGNLLIGELDLPIEVEAPPETPDLRLEPLDSPFDGPDLPPKSPPLSLEAPDIPAKPVIGKPIIFPKDTYTFTVDDLDTRNPLVWQPCLESLSPYDLFYVFKDPRDILGPGRVYVRASDAVGYYELTTEIGGGGTPDWKPPDDPPDEPPPFGPPETGLGNGGLVLDR
jgi:hypothetical protein